MIDINNFPGFARFLVSLITFSSLFVLPAYAAPNLTGDVDIVVSTQEIINIATDDASIAEVILGSFIDGKATDFQATVTTQSVTNSASGGACSQVIIGSVGPTTCLGN